MSLALRARAIWKGYAAGVVGCSARAWVLRGACLEVEQGECVAIVGGRGAGKTTLLQCIAGLRTTDAGTIETSIPPRLVDSGRVGDEDDVRNLLLVDDALVWHRRPPRRRFVREPGAGVRTTIIATPELSRVRDVADRVLLLHHGLLFPLDRPGTIRRVAEGVG